MTIVYIATFGLALLFGVTAIWALAWAIRTGQFANFRRGASSIFDEEEPIGEVTDSFPGKQDIKVVSSSGGKP